MTGAFTVWVTCCQTPVAVGGEGGKWSGRENQAAGHGTRNHKYVKGSRCLRQGCKTLMQSVALLGRRVKACVRYDIDHFAVAQRIGGGKQSADDGVAGHNRVLVP